jgi:hypothetical protein
MKKNWKKRKLLTYRFKGREPRGLLWRKDVYKEWFLYGRLFQERGGKLPKDFGDLSKFKDFEEWWRDPKYGFELFCEPSFENVEEVSGGSSKTNRDQILLKIDLRGDLEQIERDIKRILVKKDVKSDYESQSRYRPSRPMKHMKVGVSDLDYDPGTKRTNYLGMYRETFLLSEKMSEKEIGMKYGWIRKKEDWFKMNPEGKTFEYQQHLDTGVKRVRRQINFVKRTFKNLEKGTFP